MPQGVEVGQRRVVYPWIGCGECRACRRGEEHLCAHPRQIGIQVDGGYATHVMVPQPRYLLDCDGIPAGLAGTYMCSGLTSYSALKQLTTVTPGEDIMIVGLGGVGFMGLQFAKAIFNTAPLVADVNARQARGRRSPPARTRPTIPA